MPSQSKRVPTKVLLVEDDKLTRTVHRELVKQCGFWVDVAENGEAALKKLHISQSKDNIDYGLVLTDMFMPKINGEKLVELMQTSEKYRHIPVAVISSNDSAADVTRLLSIGAADYLVKPLNKAKLSTLRRFLGCNINACDATPAQQPSKPTFGGTAAQPPEPLAATPRSPSTAAHVPHLTPSTRICASLFQVADLLSFQAAPTPPASKRRSRDCITDSPQRSTYTAHLAPVSKLESGQDANAAASSPQQPSASETTSEVPAAKVQRSGGGSSSPSSSSATPVTGVFNEQPPQTVQQHQTMKSSVMMVPLQMWRTGQESRAQHVLAPGHNTTTSQQEATCAQSQVGTFLCRAGCMVPLDTRKAALARFRAKKANRKFAPKVRYAARKKLAEARPRHKGQFIKLVGVPANAAAVAQVEATPTTVA